MKELKFRIKSGGYLQIGYHENGSWVNEEHCGNAEWVVRLVRIAKSMLAHVNQPGSRTKKIEKLERKVKEKNKEKYHNELL